MDEHGFSRNIKRHLVSRKLFSWKINDGFAGGVPDFFIEGPEHDAWVEVKVGQGPAQARYHPHRYDEPATST